MSGGRDGGVGASAVVAVLCCGRSIDGRGYQVVADRFIQPIARAGGVAFVIPSIPDAVDARQVALRCDALLMTGSCSNVAPSRYGGLDDGQLDFARDEVAMAVADAMIEAGRPVLGICRGMQELNILAGGSLRDLRSSFHKAAEWHDPSVLDHSHDVVLMPDGHLRHRSGAGTVSIISAHSQGVDRLGSGLTIEAMAEDGLVEAFSSRPRSSVVGVQWHAELGSSRLDRALFEDLVAAA